MIKTLLWDFGDTLADETWMQMPMKACPGWPATYRDLVYNRPLGNSWSLGKIDADAVARILSDRIDLNTAHVLEHMQTASQNIQYFEKVMAFAHDVALPQSIVTVNPDLFSDVVVPYYRLSETFPVITTSWQLQTLSKVPICDAALSEQGLGIHRSEALLIDNKYDSIAEWVRAGGIGYLFTNEEDFDRNPPNLD